MRRGRPAGEAPLPLSVGVHIGLDGPYGLIHTAGNDVAGFVDDQLQGTLVTHQDRVAALGGRGRL